MSANRDREEEIFDTARELAADERAAYLAERCGQDADLRQRIGGMLEADAAAGEFFKTHDAPSPTVILADASLSLSIEKAGDRIGRYKLLRQILLRTGHPNPPMRPRCFARPGHSLAFPDP